MPGADEQRVETRNAYKKLSTAFRNFETVYNREETYWAFKVRGIYYWRPSADTPTPRMTLLYENVRQPGDVYVVWDTLWSLQPVVDGIRTVNMTNKAGVRIHGLMIVPEELKRSLTILVQPLDGGLPTPVHICCPENEFYGIVMECAKYPDGTHDFDLLVPRHDYAPE